MFKISFLVLVRVLFIDWPIPLIFLYPLSCDRFNKVKLSLEARRSIRSCHRATIVSFVHRGADMLPSSRSVDG